MSIDNRQVAEDTILALSFIAALATYKLVWAVLFRCYDGNYRATR